MIYTLTLNPAVDVYLNKHELKTFDSKKLSNYYCLAGGKGICVSKMLKQLKTNSVCLGFVGGISGKFIKDQLKKKKIKTDFVSIKSSTRINIKIKQPKELEVNGVTPSISKSEYLKLKDKLLKLKKGDALIIGGSMSKNIDLKLAKQVLTKLKSRGVKFILDTSSKYLFDFCKYNPILLKPNIHELANLFNKKILSKKEVIKYAKKLISLGAKNVMVSLGPKGAILTNGKQTYYSNAPKGKVVSTVGCGDSTVAGFILKYLQHMNLIDCLRFAVACGSATAFCQEMGRLDNIIILSNKIKVHKV